MKFKNNIFLLLVLIVLGVLVWLVERPFEDKAEKARDEAGFLFPDLQHATVKKLQVMRPDGDNPIVLKNVDNAWYVVKHTSKDSETSEEHRPEDTEDTPSPESEELYPADENTVIEAIDRLRTIQKLNLASQQAEKHELFEVTPEKAIQVTAYGPEDEQLAHLFIGKEGPGFFSTYLRREGVDEVYLHEEFIKGSFDRQPDNWRDRNVFDFESSQVAELTIQKDEQTIVLAKDENNLWHLKKPTEGPADSAKVTRILTSLSSLRAGSFADTVTVEESGLEQPAQTIAATFEDGGTKKLLVGNKKQENYFYAKAEDKKYVYEIYKSVVEKLFPPVEELEKKEAGPATEASPPSVSEETETDTVASPE